MFRRVLIVAVLLVSLFLVVPADAGKGWCRGDPAFRVGSVNYVATASAEIQLQSATFIIQYPAGMDTELKMELAGVAVTQETIWQPVQGATAVTIIFDSVPKPGTQP